MGCCWPPAPSPPGVPYVRTLGAGALPTAGSAAAVTCHLLSDTVSEAELCREAAKHRRECPSPGRFIQRFTATLLLSHKHRVLPEPPPLPHSHLSCGMVRRAQGGTDLSPPPPCTQMVSGCQDLRELFFFQTQSLSWLKARNLKSACRETLQRFI